MTINNASSTLSTNASNAMYMSSSSSSLSKTELTQEEQQYDIDSDGELSITEKAAMQEAQAQQKALQSTKSSVTTEADSVEISEEALKMQKQNQSEPPEEGVDRTEAYNNRQKMYNEAISEYKKYNLD